MKITTNLLAMAGLFTLVIGAAIPEENISKDVDSVNPGMTPYEWCANAYTECKKRCALGYHCGAVCMRVACTTTFQGKACGALCGWNC